MPYPQRTKDLLALLPLLASTSLAGKAFIFLRRTPQSASVPVNSTFKLPCQAMFVLILSLTNLCQLLPSKHTSSWFSVAPPVPLHPSSPLNSPARPSHLFQALREAHLTPDVTRAREGAPDSYGPARSGAWPPPPPQFPPRTTRPSERSARTSEL